MQSADVPLLTALLLGILFALNPCQLAICISALSYLSKQSAPTGTFLAKGLVFAFGRFVTYSAMGAILALLFAKGLALDWLTNCLSKAETVLPYILMALGCIFIYRGIHRHHHDGKKCHNSGYVIKRQGHLGAFVLGMLLALAFCPESTILYFGMLVPLSASAKLGAFLPPLFSVSAIAPVICLAFLITYATEKIRKLERVFERIQQWSNIIIGTLFLAFAIIELCF